MLLSEKISEDLKNAMKAHEADKVGLLRFLNAQLQNRMIEKYPGNKEAKLADEEILEVFQKEAKRRRESIVLFKQGKRDDLVQKEEHELAMLSEYLPKQLSESEIMAIIDKLYGEGKTDFNLLMREAAKETKGKADGRLVSELVKKKVT